MGDGRWEGNRGRQGDGAQRNAKPRTCSHFLAQAMLDQGSATLSSLPQIIIAQVCYFVDARSAAAVGRTQREHHSGSARVLELYLLKYQSALRLAESLVEDEDRVQQRLGNRWSPNYFHYVLYEGYYAALWRLVECNILTRIPQRFFTEWDYFRKRSEKEWDDFFD